MTDKSIKTVINALAIIAIIAGLGGMLFCFPFLWSGRMEDLVGAGLSFVGGSILFWDRTLDSRNIQQTDDKVIFETAGSQLKLSKECN